MRDFILEELDKLKTRITVDLLQQALRDYLIDPCRSEDQDIVQDFCFPLIELLTQEEIYSILYQCFLCLTHARQLDIIYKLKKQESVVKDLLENPKNPS